MVGAAGNIPTTSTSCAVRRAYATLGNSRLHFRVSLGACSATESIPTFLVSDTLQDAMLDACPTQNEYTSASFPDVVP